MKKKFILFLVFTAVIPFLTESCKLTSPDDNDVVTEGGKLTLTGEVIDSVSGNPLEGAVIFIETDSLDFGDATDAGGQFSIEIEVRKSQTVYISVSKEGYYERVFTQRVIAGNNVEMPAFQLRPFDDVAEKSIEPASINLYSQNYESIGVKESGSIEVAEIIFEIRDSSGVILDLDHKQTVNFKLGNSLGGGEYLFPSSTVSNGKGQATVALNSGTVAGVVQVIAEINFEGTIIRSKPVLIAIHGGLPDQAHFGIALNQYNIPGLIEFGFQDEVTVFIGDKYSNPVRPGTSVYFNTTEGIIEGSALTNDLGIASVTLISNYPHSSDGFGTVTATTIDENSNFISVQSPILFSGAPIVTINPADNNFNIPNGGTKTFNYMVNDLNGNPIAANSSISVIVEGKNVTLSGNTNIVLSDILYGGTNYTFYLSDSTPEEIEPVSITLTIKATVPLQGGGSRTYELLISGTSN